MFTRSNTEYGLCLTVVLLVGFLFAVSGCKTGRENYFLDPQTTSLLIRAEDALKHHEFTQALTLADSAEMLTPGAPETFFLRGRILSEMVRFDEAEAAYRKVIKLRPDFRGAWHNLGSNFSRQYKYNEAITSFKKELEFHPSPMTWRGIGRAYRELNMTDSAIYAFGRAIEMDSVYAPALIDMAQVLDIQGDYEASFKYAERALVAAPTTEAHYYVGSQLVKMRRWEEALEHLYLVSKEWPWHNSTLYNIGQALVRLGRQEEAQKYLKEAESLRAAEAKITEMQKKVRLVPDDAYAHAGLGSLLRRVGRYNDAMHAYQIAINLDPENLEFQVNAAVLEYLRGNNEAAIAGFRRILEKDPDYVDAWINLGTVLVKSGKPEEALIAWETALQYDPDNQMVLSNLQKMTGTQGVAVHR